MAIAKRLAMKRRDLIRGIGSLALLGVSPNFAQVLDLNDAINKAGRQRMLSQRAAKAYLATGQSLLGERSREVLGTSIALFDRQLAELKAYAPTPEIRDTYTLLESAWGDYRAVLAGRAPSREGAPALIALDGKVLTLAHKGTVQLEQLSGRPVGRLVNVAGRQRMLSQRVAKFYLALAWKAEVPNAATEIDKARAEFVQALDLLHNAPEATASIRRELELARNQWVFYESAIAQRGVETAMPERCSNVFLSSENILTVMDKVTGLYARVVG